VGVIANSFGFQSLMPKNFAQMSPDRRPPDFQTSFQILLVL